MYLQQVDVLGMEQGGLWEEAAGRGGCRGGREGNGAGGVTGLMEMGMAVTQRSG